MSRIALQIARKSVRVSGIYFALHATRKRAVYVTKKRKRGSIWSKLLSGMIRAAKLVTSRTTG